MYIYILRMIGVFDIVCVDLPAIITPVCYSYKKIIDLAYISIGLYAVRVCEWCILGVSQTEQRIRHLTSSQIRIMFGMETSMKDLLSRTHIKNGGSLKGYCLGGCHGVGLHIHWKDKVRRDLVSLRLTGTALFKIGMCGDTCAKKDCRGY